MNKADDILTRTKRCETVVKNAMSERDKLRGEENALLKHRQELIEEIMEKFGCTPKELLEQIPIKKAELETLLEEIEGIIADYE
jgi:hypothetical protein